MPTRRRRLGSRHAFRLLSVVTLVVLLFANLGSAYAAAESSSLAAQAAATDPRFYSQTNFRIDNDKFWDYFQHRGGINTFGYPVSRTFQFLGSTVQFFQRRILQLNADGSVGQINLLDSTFMPYTTINGANFPAGDPNVIKAAPVVGSPNYGIAVLAWILQTAPNSFNSLPVNFGGTFQNTVAMA